MEDLVPTTLLKRRTVMKVLVKPRVEPTEQEKLYEALQCGEYTCFCNSFKIIGDEETDDILF